MSHVTVSVAKGRRYLHPQTRQPLAGNTELLLTPRIQRAINQGDLVVADKPADKPAIKKDS